MVLFESSGMYNGEDVPWLVSHLTGRLDAVWGSRRLSVRDIEESLRLKYRHRALLGAASAVGSHVLSLMYLALYGRYVVRHAVWRPSGARGRRVQYLAAADASASESRDALQAPQPEGGNVRSARALLFRVAGAGEADLGLRRASIDGHDRGESLETPVHAVSGPGRRVAASVALSYHPMISTRVLIVPAAGRGQRLGSSVPKVLVPVNGRPMLHHLLDLYAPLSDVWSSWRHRTRATK